MEIEEKIERYNSVKRKLTSILNQYGMDSIEDYEQSYNLRLNDYMEFRKSMIRLLEDELNADLIEEFNKELYSKLRKVYMDLSQEVLNDILKLFKRVLARDMIRDLCNDIILTQVIDEFYESFAFSELWVMSEKEIEDSLLDTIKRSGIGNMNLYLSILDGQNSFHFKNIRDEVSSDLEEAIRESFSESLRENNCPSFAYYGAGVYCKEVPGRKDIIDYVSFGHNNPVIAPHSVKSLGSMNMVAREEMAVESILTQCIQPIQLPGGRAVKINVVDSVFKQYGVGEVKL